MACYVDGFVLPVPRRNMAKYKRLARKAARIFLEHGALEVVEAIEDDVKPGRLTSFAQSVKQKRSEVVFFSYIVFRSRKHRDRVNAKVMVDPRLAGVTSGRSMPFDGRRMIYGGFRTAVHLRAKQARP